MAFTLKLGALDLSPYPRLAPGDGFDPYDNDWIEPGFTDSPFAEGNPLASVDVKNREMAIPLFLKGASKDALHALVRSVQAEIRKVGTQELLVEWADDGATASTFYTVVFARWEPEFSFRRGQHGWLAGVLRVWVTGYGHTGSYRIAATTPVTASAAAIQVPIASIGGDAPGLLDLVVRSGSAVSPIYGAQLLAAPLSHPSQVAVWPAASMTLAAGANATLTGASGAQGSQVVAMLAASAAPTLIASAPERAYLTLPLASVYAGQRYRVAALNRSLAVRGIALNLEGPDGAIGPTAVASMIAAGYTLNDLGVLSIPSVVPSQVTVALRAGQIQGASRAVGNHDVQASSPYAYHLNALMLLPETGIHGVNDSQLTPLVRDFFSATYYPVVGKADDLGNVWASQAVNAYVNPAWGLVGPSGAGLGVNAQIRLARPVQDHIMRAVIRTSASAFAWDLVSGNQIGVIGMDDNRQVFLSYAAFASNRSFLSITAGGSIVASAALASTGARVFQFESGVSDRRAWTSLRALGAQPYFASTGASHANLNRRSIDSANLSWQYDFTGAPASFLASPALSWDRFEVFAFASQAANPRQVYHLGQRYLADASDNPVRDVSGRALGAPPVISPSAPAVAVVEQVPGEAANDLLDVTVRVRERFTVAR